MLSHARFHVSENRSLPNPTPYSLETITVVSWKSAHSLLLVQFPVWGQSLLEWAPTLKRALHDFYLVFLLVACCCSYLGTVDVSLISSPPLFLPFCLHSYMEAEKHWKMGKAWGYLSHEWTQGGHRRRWAHLQITCSLKASFLWPHPKPCVFVAYITIPGLPFLPFLTFIYYCKYKPNKMVCLGTRLTKDCVIYSTAG